MKKISVARFQHPLIRRHSATPSPAGGRLISRGQRPHITLRFRATYHSKSAVLGAFPHNSQRFGHAEAYHVCPSRANISRAQSAHITLRFRATYHSKSAVLGAALSLSFPNNSQRFGMAEAYHVCPARNISRGRRPHITSRRCRDISLKKPPFMAVFFLRFRVLHNLRNNYPLKM